MAQIGYIESILGGVTDNATRLAIRRVAEELLGRIAVLEAATGVVPDTPGGPVTPPMENVAFTDQPNVFTENQDVSKVRPEIRLYHPGDLAKARLLQAVAGGRLDLTYNLSYDPAFGWLRDDIAKTGQSLLLNEAGFAYRAIGAGANPAAIAAIFVISPLGRVVVTQGSTYALELQHLNHTGMLFTETGQPVDGKKWRIHGNVGNLYIEPLNDAETAVMGPRTLTFNRNGTVTTGSNLLTTGVVYPGRADNGQVQGSWYLASHGSYGLYTNTGLYLAGPIFPVGGMDPNYLLRSTPWTNVGHSPAIWYAYTATSTVAHAYYIYNNVMTVTIWVEGTFQGGNLVAVQIPAGRSPSLYASAACNIQINGSAPYVCAVHAAPGDVWLRVNPQSSYNFPSTAGNVKFQISFPLA